jgi:hypothetical protein
MNASASATLPGPVHHPLDGLLHGMTTAAL